MSRRTAETMETANLTEMVFHSSYSHDPEKAVKTVYQAIFDEGGRVPVGQFHIGKCDDDGFRANIEAYASDPSTLESSLRAQFADTPVTELSVTAEPTGEDLLEAAREHYEAELPESKVDTLLDQLVYGADAVSSPLNLDHRDLPSTTVEIDTLDEDDEQSLVELAYSLRLIHPETLDLHRCEITFLVPYE